MFNYENVETTEFTKENLEAQEMMRDDVESSTEMNSKDVELSEEIQRLDSAALRELASDEFAHNGATPLREKYLELAAEKENKENVKDAEKMGSKFTIDSNINGEYDDYVGSSCEDFCQDTRTNRTQGNYTREGR